jgi:hypothetical protein
VLAELVELRILEQEEAFSCFIEEQPIKEQPRRNLEQEVEYL